MNNATVVTLGPLKEGAQEVTFEEAFGEHSEFRGRGRSRRAQRRHERRMKRIKAHNEEKLARQEARLEKRRRRRALKDEGKDEATSEDDSKTSSPSEEQTSEHSSDDVQASNDNAPNASDDSGSSRDDSGSSSSEDSGSDDSQSEDSSSDDSGSDESGFDGVMTEVEEQEFSVDGKAIVHPRVADLMNRIKWNHLAIKKLKSRMNRQNAPAMQKKINEHKSRIILLQDELNDVKASLKKTKIARSLNAKISKNKIVVPEGKSNATGPIGLVGVDDYDDYDAPDTRVVEITSNADGLTSGGKINWKPIIVGAAIGAVIIYAMKKGKVFGK